MPMTFRSRALVSLIGVTSALILPRAARWQAPSASTVTVNADGTATVSVVGPGRAAFAQGRAIVRFRTGTDFLPGSGPARELSRVANVHLVNNPPGLSVQNVIAR